MLSKIIKYICNSYPYKDELSRSRLIKIIYLCDWEYVLKYNIQLTSIEWFFNERGPYTNVIMDEVFSNKDIATKQVENMFGNEKTLIFYNGKVKLPKKVKKVIDKIIQKTSILSWRGFINYIYDSYPIVKSKRFSKLDLININ